MKDRRRKLCYQISKQTSSGGYTSLLIRAFFLDEEPLKGLIEGTVDNKAGYGSKDTAERLGEWYRDLEREGHKVVLMHPFTEPHSVTFSWLELRDYNGSGKTFSEAKLEGFGGDKYIDVFMGMRLARRIGVRIEKMSFDRKGGPQYSDDKPASVDNRTFGSPTLLIAAIQRIKGQRVRHTSNRHGSDWIYDKGQREWLFSDTLLESFEAW